MTHVTLFLNLNGTLLPPPPPILSNCKGTLDELLCNYTIPEDVLSRNNLFCEDHSVIIDSRHEHIVKSLITAAQQHIPFTQPYSELSRTHPGETIL